MENKNIFDSIPMPLCDLKDKGQNTCSDLCCYALLIALQKMKISSCSHVAVVQRHDYLISAIRSPRFHSISSWQKMNPVRDQFHFCTRP